MGDNSYIAPIAKITAILGRQLFGGGKSTTYNHLSKVSGQQHFANFTHNQLWVQYEYQRKGTRKSKPQSMTG